MSWDKCSCCGKDLNTPSNTYCSQCLDDDEMSQYAMYDSFDWELFKEMCDDHDWKKYENIPCDNEYQLKSWDQLTDDLPDETPWDETEKDKLEKKWDREEVGDDICFTWIDKGCYIYLMGRFIVKLFRKT